MEQATHGDCLFLLGFADECRMAIFPNLLVRWTYMLVTQQHQYAIADQRKITRTTVTTIVKSAIKHKHIRNKGRLCITESLTNDFKQTPEWLL